MGRCSAKLSSYPDLTLEHGQSSQRTARRPTIVTWLAVTVFCLAGINAARVAVSLAEWRLWAGFDQPFPLALRVALSGGMALALGVTAWGLWKLHKRSRLWALILLPLYQVYELTWRLGFARGDYERGRVPFTLGTTIAGIAIAVWILTRRRVIREFERNGTPEETTG